jgi:hypothetical protein
MDDGFTIPIALHPGIKPDDSDGDLTRAPNRPQPTSHADFGDKTPPGAPPVIAGTLRAVLAAAPLPENSGYHGGDAAVVRMSRLRSTSRSSVAQLRTPRDLSCTRLHFPSRAC